MRIKFIIPLILISLTLSMLTTGCNNNKIACPTYSDSFPNAKKKKSKKPSGGIAQDNAPHYRKSKSGVMPSDGRGTRTKLPR